MIYTLVGLKGNMDELDGISDDFEYVVNRKAKRIKASADEEFIRKTSQFHCWHTDRTRIKRKSIHSKRCEFDESHPDCIGFRQNQRGCGNVQKSRP